MYNLKFAIPFFLLFAHQNLSNSIFGLNYPIIGISLFLSFIFSCFFFLLFNEKVGVFKIVVMGLAVIFIALWMANPLIFKDIAFFYLNIFISYYVVSQNGFQYVKRHLSFLVIASFILGVIQISGVSNFVHLLNSQYLVDSKLGVVQNIEITNIITSNVDKYFDFDSRQVRPPGIFHSSAVLSGIFVLYITYVFLGIFKSIKYYALIPFLCVYSGSKLVLSVTIVFVILGIIFRRMSLKEFSILAIGALIGVISHKLLFSYLIEFQFNYDIFLYSFDIRFVQYSMDNLDFTYILSVIYKILILFVGIILINNVFKFIPSSFKIYNFLILFIALFSSFFATPHVANLLFGWFYFPSFFFLKELSPKKHTFVF